jgi:Protein of unknown function (DUF1670)
MATITADDRLALKTSDATLLHILQQEFNFSQRVSREILVTAKEVLLGGSPAEAVRPGQVRRIVASLQAPFGPPLTETDKIEVTLTVDAGAEDAEVKARDGLEGLRRGRILRIVDEALQQDGVLTQEDLAQVLNVDVRTIRRDVAALKAEGQLVHTRGPMKGVGRGQTHKIHIIELWLDREGYDKISRWVHHSFYSIQRYINTFQRVVVLHQEGMAAEQIAFLVRSSVRLVQDYLTVYEAALTVPRRREKLAEELARVSGWSAPLPGEGCDKAEKGGAAA